jgi:hypothetical protein
MAHLLSFIDTRPQFEIANPPAPPLLRSQSINTAPRTALLVANESLVKLLRRCLEEEGYTIRIASNTEEGRRLYSDFAPFNVVIIEYDAPERNGVQIDVSLPQTSGRKLASDILKDRFFARDRLCSVRLSEPGRSVATAGITTFINYPLHHWGGHLPTPALL